MVCKCGAVMEETKIDSIPSYKCKWCGRSFPKFPSKGSKSKQSKLKILKG